MPCYDGRGGRMSVAFTILGIGLSVLLLDALVCGFYMSFLCEDKEDYWLFPLIINVIWVVGAMTVLIWSRL